MSSTESKSYGAIPRGDGEEENADFRYLGESSFSWNRFCRAVFPVIIALLVMGGFAFGMGHGFNHLYGPPKSSGDNSINEWPDDDSSNTPAATVSSSSSSSSSTSSTATKSSSEAACSAHPKCKSLALTGDCCPHDGVVLGCCG